MRHFQLSWELGDVLHVSYTWDVTVLHYNHHNQYLPFLLQTTRKFGTLHPYVIVLPPLLARNAFCFILSETYDKAMEYATGACSP